MTGLVSLDDRGLCVVSRVASSREVIVSSLTLRPPCWSAGSVAGVPRPSLGVCVASCHAEVTICNKRTLKHHHTPLTSVLNTDASDQVCQCLVPIMATLCQHQTSSLNVSAVATAQPVTQALSPGHNTKMSSGLGCRAGWGDSSRASVLTMNTNPDSANQTPQ